MGKFFARYELAYWEQPREAVIMWTIGTSLVDSPENRKILSSYWKYFRMRMNTRGKWNPIFRVVEAGSKGNRLHIHFLNVGKLLHSDVLTTWRRITREKSNVQFAKRDETAKPVYYVMKYLTKDKSTYSILGALRKIKFEKREPKVCSNHALPFEYEGLIAGAHNKAYIDLLVEFGVQ